MSLRGGFLFAIVDHLESIIQFGLGISQAENEYTQHIDLWYSENPTEKVSPRPSVGTITLVNNLLILAATCHFC